jgi:HK97 family phage major capsid protein
MRYGHIIAEVLSQPWAILDAKFDAIVSVLARREAGEEWTEEQIRAAVGERKSKREMYCVTDEGSSFPYGALLEKQATAGSGPSKGKLTAVIPIYGMILPRAADFDMSEVGTSIESLRKNFSAAMSNPDVKAVVFDVDSPGGSVYHVEEFAQEIYNAAGGAKKIVSQVNSLAASAAYYLASQADEIVITPSGEAGSIGVRMMHQDISKALEMKGIKVTNVTYGKYKVENNPFEPMSEEGLAFAQQRVNDYGDMFVKALARGREMKVSQVKEDFGEGRVFGAAEAKKRGMVDRVATLDETLSRLGASAESARVPMGASAEASVVTPTATAENNTEVQVNETTVQTSAAAADEARGAERDRVAQIMQIASMHRMEAKAMDWIARGLSVEQVKTTILDSLKPASIAQPSAESAARIVSDEHDKLPAGALAGRAMRAIAGAHKFKTTPALFSAQVLRDPALASKFQAQSAAGTGQTAGDQAGGGWMFGDSISSDFIELLRPQSVVRSLTPTMAPLINGTLNVPKMKGGTTGYWIGETKAPTPSKITGGNVKASAKKCAAIALISNDLLRFAPISADTMTRDDAVLAVNQAQDLAYIRSAGTEYRPKGLATWCPAANKLTMTATPTLATTRGDLGRMILAIRKADVPFRRLGWIMSPRTEYWLMWQCADGNGNLFFNREMLEMGTLLGKPYRVTTQIPETLGGGTETELYLADFADVVLTDGPEVAIEVSTEAAIYDSGWQRDRRVLGRPDGAASDHVHRPDRSPRRVAGDADRADLGRLAPPR